MCLSAIACLGLAWAVTAAPADNSGFSNTGFESGVEGWSVWYSDNPKAEITRYPWSADPTVAHSGRQSLKIVAPDEHGCAFVNRMSSGMKPHTSYYVSYWCRKSPELDEKTFRLRFNFRPADPAKADWRFKSATVAIARRKTEGEWHYRAGYIRTPKGDLAPAQIGLYLKAARGAIWIDDVRVEEVDPQANRVADLWVYDPYRGELGQVPLKKHRALVEASDPTLARAKRYNEVLVRSAFVKEDVRRVVRLSGYLDEGLSAEAKGLSKRMADAEAALARLYRAYGHAFLGRKDASKAAAFASQASALEAQLAALQADAAKGMAARLATLRAAGKRWDPPPQPLDAGLPAISGDGRVNQIIYGNRSTWMFRKLEEPLGFDLVHSTTVGAPKSPGRGRYDWSTYDAQWRDIQSTGIPKKSCLLLFVALHDGCYTPKWLWEEIKKDPEVRHPVPAPAKLKSRGNRTQLNWWHPLTQAYGREIVTDMGRTFRDRDEFLFYVFQWECHGPVASTDKGLRQVGYGAHAETDFRSWLREKYGTVAALNKRWGSSYATLDSIEPPACKFTQERQHAGPLAAEWEAWREHSYYRWCRLLYRAWKKADPNKPVIAGHSNLFRRFSMPDVSDTCDMLGFHCGGLDFMPGTMYIHSISRYNGQKPLAQYENFWGTQEDHDRMHEEPAKRHSAQKHVFRLTAWDRFLQIWWYSYTSATYLTHYDGNYFDPSYALTTLRYRSAGLPVYFRKFKRLQRALLESRIVPARICLLAPTASMRNAFPHGACQREIRDLFWLLFPRNYHVELVPEEYFLDGRAQLDDFDVVALPYAVYLSNALQDKIIRWLDARARLLFCCGPGGLYDEIGLRSKRVLDRAFPKTRRELRFVGQGRWVWTEAEGEPDQLITGRVGPSRVCLVPTRLGDLRHLPEVAASIVAHVEAATDRAASDEANAFEMVLREQGPKRYLCVLNPSLDDPAASRVRVQGAFRRVADLDYDEAAPVPAAVSEGYTVFPLRLEPGEATILRLEP